MIIAEFSVIPLGTETTSVSGYVRAALKELKELEKEGRIKIKPEAMGTIIEAKNLEEIFNAVERAHEAVFRLGVKRLVTEIKIDDRRDKESSIESKVNALKQENFPSPSENFVALKFPKGILK
ncbi:MAG: thiamine-binding protein [Candidatus Altiarchaeales archaeon]|nr:MAG: thiamine-binding protein [Candidatus Altiarchaeales archaeon]